MLKTLHDAEIVPFTYVVADCLYGNRPEFLEAVERDVDLVYVVAIPADTRAWLRGRSWRPRSIAIEAKCAPSGR